MAVNDLFFSAARTPLQACFYLGMTQCDGGAVALEDLWLLAVYRQGLE